MVFFSFFEGLAPSTSPDTSVSRQLLSHAVMHAYEYHQHLDLYPSTITHKGGTLFYTPGLNARSRNAITEWAFLKCYTSLPSASEGKFAEEAQ